MEEIRPHIAEIGNWDKSRTPGLNKLFIRLLCRPPYVLLPGLLHLPARHAEMPERWQGK